MKTITLTQGKEALVDDEDYEVLSKYKWYAWKGRSTFYALTNIKKKGKKTTMYMHRFILKAKKDEQVDHKNFNGLDNRLSNIRLCTPSQNQWNHRVQKNNTSGCPGVCWDINEKKWKVMIHKYGRLINLGRFSSKAEAIEVRNEATKKLRGQFTPIFLPYEFSH